MHPPAKTRLMREQGHSSIAKLMRLAHDHNTEYIGLTAKTHLTSTGKLNWGASSYMHAVSVVYW